MKRFFGLVMLLLVLLRPEADAQVPSLGPDIIVCQDQIVILDAGSGFSSYLWNTGSTTQSIVVTLAGLYWVEVTNSSGATMRDSVNVMYYPPMLPLTVTVSSPSCGMSNGAIIIIEPEELDYLYSIDGGITFQEEEHFTGLAAGVYEIIAEDMNGCAEFLMTVTLQDMPGPIIVDIETTPATNVQSNGTITIHATGESLTYSINGSPPQSSPYFTGLPAGVYYCSAIDIFGCIITSEATVEMITSTNRVLPHNHYFTVSPNPAKGTINLEVDMDKPANYGVTIYNSFGIAVSTVPATQSTRQELIIHHLSPGLYFVSMEINGQRYVEKLVVF